MDCNENNLIEKCKNGDIDAFEVLIKKYKETAYNIALKILRNSEDAMDVSQEALIKVYKYMNHFNQRASFSTWLYKIVMNTCLDFIKKNKNKTYSFNEIVDKKDYQHTPEEALDRKIKIEAVQKAINRLSPNFRNVIILRDIHGFSYDEIANMTNCSLGTVKSRIKRGREQLKNFIKEDRNDEENQSY